MAWAAVRRAIKEEDRVYCLVGILEIAGPFVYGKERTKPLLQRLRDIDEMTSKNRVCLVAAYPYSLGHCFWWMCVLITNDCSITLIRTVDTENAFKNYRSACKPTRIGKISYHSIIGLNKKICSLMSVKTYHADD